MPGMKTHLWFNATEAGTYDIFCTEYCGVGHSHMLSKVIVMPVSDFGNWYKTVGAPGAMNKGLQLLESKGCLGCHTVDGTKKIGPTFKGLLGNKVNVVTDGKERTITADEDYIKRSILQPGADIVKGFPNIMPAIPVTEGELETIIEYMENLK